MTRLGSELEERVLDNLGGRVLQQRRGRLAAAQSLLLDVGEGRVTASVGFYPAQVAYGAIQEYGGKTRAHLIAAKNARALAFDMRGRLAFAKRVQHPGSVLPERSFLRAALDDMRGQSSEIADAVGTELEA